VWLLLPRRERRWRDRAADWATEVDEPNENPELAPIRSLW